MGNKIKNYKSYHPNYLKREKTLNSIFEKFYEIDGKTLFLEKELREIFNENKRILKMASFSFTKFIKYLKDNNYIKEVIFNTQIGKRKIFKSKYYNNLEHFRNALEISLLLLPRGFISHYTAVYIHGLTEQIPKVIYINTEQPIKYSIEEKKKELSQEKIDLAFSKAARISDKFYLNSYEGYKIKRISGKDTKKAGVIRNHSLFNLNIPITNLERTLIDIAVKPEYSGGIFEVFKVYKNAIENGVNILKLVSILKRINYIYPYHQVIGFLLDTAGLPEDKLKPFKEEFEFKYNFYLLHGHLKDKCIYVPEWKIFIPKECEMVLK